MHDRKPPPDFLVYRAAEARATGKSWAAVGKIVGRSLHTVSKWPRAYPDRWDAALRAAARGVIELAAAQAVGTLQKLLVSQDEEIQTTAAWRLLWQRIEQWKIDLRLSGTKPAGNPNQDDPSTLSIRNTPREQRLQILGNMRTTPLPVDDGTPALSPARAG